MTGNAVKFARSDKMRSMTTGFICTHAASALLLAATCTRAIAKKARRQLTQARF